MLSTKHIDTICWLYSVERGSVVVVMEVTTLFWKFDDYLGLAEFYYITERFCEISS